MKSILLLIFVSVIFISSASDKKEPIYPAFTISEKLKKDANAVCREYTHEFELKDYGKATERVKMVVTILNEKGEQFGNLLVFYDKLVKVTIISGKSYDALGFQDDKLKNSSINDVNITTSGSIYDSYRMKVAHFETDTYPYTIEYQYEIEHNGLLAYPNWKPVSDFRYAIEKSSFVVSWPEGMEIRIKELNLPYNCLTSKKENGKNISEWKLDTLSAIREEPYSPEIYTFTPQVLIAPTQFSYDGFPGKMTTWNEFGTWIWKLNEGRDQLPLQRQTEIRNLVGEFSDTTSVVKQLYEYMQKRTRYVGIQLGIGGFQPFPAETVDRLGYGDCKALSNYMRAILNCAGIPSVYTIAGVASNPGILYTEFPSINQNNHAVVCVPINKDTLWLECTSQTQPFGFFSEPSANRTVLLITENGGILTKTPKLNAKQNQQLRSAEINIAPDGSMKGSVTTYYSGYQYDFVASVITESYKEQEKKLLDDMALPGLKISGINYSEEKDILPFASETFLINSELFATKTGVRLFIPLNVFNKRKSSPQKTENRQLPVVQDYSYYDKDSLTFLLPDGYQTETLPKGKTIKTEFGEYISNINQTDNRITYTREITINKGEWPKEKYAGFVEFFSKIVEFDKAKLVMKQL
jgi:hypothetical protein